MRMTSFSVARPGVGRRRTRLGLMPPSSSSRSANVCTLARAAGMASPHTRWETADDSIEAARGRVFGFSELAGVDSGLQFMFSSRQFRKTEHPTPRCEATLLQRIEDQP